MRDLSELTFTQAVEELHIEQHPTLPLLCVEDRLLLFRGESNAREDLFPAYSKNHSLYGEGVYAGNCPSSVASFAYGANRNVGVYALDVPDNDPPFEFFTGRLSERSGAAIKIFPPPLRARLNRRIHYRGKRQDPDIPLRWLLIASNRPDIYESAERIATLGDSAIGIARP